MYDIFILFNISIFMHEICSDRVDLKVFCNYMYLYYSLVEYKYFLFGTIVRSGVTVDVGVEIHVVILC